MNSNIMQLLRCLTRILRAISTKNEKRDITIKEGNYNKYIEGIYIKGIYIKVDNLSKPTGFPQNIPKSSTDKFVGRKKELKLLHQQLQDNDRVTIAHLEGMGGIGKTELAILYSLTNLHCNTYPGGICWLSSREQDVGLQIVNFVRTHFDLKPPEDLELPNQVDWCWAHWKKGNTLIVLDDVKNFSDIKPYLPPEASQFKVLIITELQLDLPNLFYLEVFSEQDAIKLLIQLVGSKKVKRKLAKTKELCQHLGYLPLALQLVGQYVKERGISLTKKLQRLKDKELANPSLSVPENDPPWTLNINPGVAAAFELIWEELSEPAQELGCLLSLFALAPIPWSLVESAALEQDTKKLEDARAELENLHLLQGEDGEDNYQLHQLIQEFLRTKQNNLATADEQKRNFCTATVEIAKKIPQALTLSDINSLNPFIPHLAETATVYRNWLSNEDLTWPFTGLGRFYEGQRAYTQALPWTEQCLSIARERLGEKHPDVAISLNNLGLLYYSQERYQEAEPLLLQALQLRKKLLGEEHPKVATSLNNLAALYRAQKKYESAEPLYLQVLELRKRLLGGEHPDIAQSCNNLALLYYLQRKYSEAEPLFLQALELGKKLLGEEHLFVATSLNNLAALYAKQSRYESAEPLFLQALELRKRLLGEEHPQVTTSLNNLAALYAKQSRYESAEPLYQQALTIAEKILGQNHPNTKTIRKNYEQFQEEKNND